MSKFNVGDKVKYIGKDHRETPEFYPEIGTIGTVVKESEDTDWYIQWPKGSTSGKDCWYCYENDIELVENVDMTNKEIWEMLRPKMEKNGLTSNIYSCTKLDDNGFPCFFLEEAYKNNDVHNAIALAYKVGYLRSQKGRPFKIGEKKKKGGHWEPVDPNNLPKEGTKVRYSRECEPYVSTPEMIALGDIGEFGYSRILNLPGIRFDDDRYWDWVSFSNALECLDMWVEDDE